MFSSATLLFAGLLAVYSQGAAAAPASGLKEIDEIADAFASGGGSVGLGKITTKDNAFTRTDQLSALGSANGDAFGQGTDLKVFDIAKTDAKSVFSQRARRDIVSEIQEMADSFAVGGGSAEVGKISSSNNGFSRTDKDSSVSFASGNAQGEGKKINVFENATSNAKSIFRSRVRRDLLREIQNAANGVAIGSGSADQGELSFSEQGSSQTNEKSAMGSASGSASGKGRGLVLLEKAESKASSGLIQRQKRQAASFPSINLQSLADSSAVGSLSAEQGVLSSEDASSSLSQPDLAVGKASGKGAGQGSKIRVLETVKSHSQVHDSIPFAL
jgi:hypothetical protein